MCFGWVRHRARPARGRASVAGCSSGRWPAARRPAVVEVACGAGNRARARPRRRRAARSRAGQAGGLGLGEALLLGDLGAETEQSLLVSLGLLVGEGLLVCGEPLADQLDVGLALAPVAGAERHRRASAVGSASCQLGGEVGEPAGGLRASSAALRASRSAVRARFPASPRASSASGRWEVPGWLAGPVPGWAAVLGFGAGAGSAGGFAGGSPAGCDPPMTGQIGEPSRRYPMASSGWPVSGWTSVAWRGRYLGVIATFWGGGRRRAGRVWACRDSP
jgi:hypothetical protein